MRLVLIAPALVLSAVSFILFGIDAVQRKGSSRVSRTAFGVAVLGLFAAAAFLPYTGDGAPVVYGRGMLVADGLSMFLSWIVVVSTLLVVLISEQETARSDSSSALYYGMLLLSATGLLLAVAAQDFLMIFVAIEMVGIPAFTLTGFYRKSQKSVEAAIKFFLIGAFSSAMLAYGVSLLYGLLGSTSLTALHQSGAVFHEKAPLALLAVFFIVVSFGFKMALVPFHLWVPDVFEGAPTPIAAYLSVAPKMVGAALVVRVFNIALPLSSPGVFHLLAVLAALTMTVANLIGLQQKSVVRLLAYSSIAHMGYVLLGILAGGQEGLASVYLYGWIYLFMNLGAFSIVICLSRALHASDLTDYEGLSRRSPTLSALLALFLISLAGLPPTAGFVAKFYVFSAAYHAGWITLLVIALLNSVIAVGYYFRILHAMYFKGSGSKAEVRLSLSMRLVLGVTSFATLFLGVAPQVGIAHVKKFLPSPPVVSVTLEP